MQILVKVSYIKFRVLAVRQPLIYTMVEEHATKASLIQELKTNLINKFICFRQGKSKLVYQREDMLFKKLS